MSMELGLVVPHYKQISAIEALARFARRAEELAFDALWVTDHIVVPDGAVSRFGENYHEPLTVLAYLAAITQRIRLGTSALILPYRNPVHQAKIMSTLDHLSGGRMTFAVGAGWSEDETRVMGADFHQRGKLCWEYIKAFREIWSQRNPRFHGDFVRIDGVTVGPPPVQDPLPLWGAGNSKAAMKRAARLCQGWHPTRPALAALREDIPRFRQMVAEAGREGEVDVIAARLPIKFGIPGDDDAPPLFGSVEQVVDKLSRYREAGVNAFVIDTFYSMRELDGEDIDSILDTAQRLAEEVLPKVR